MRNNIKKLRTETGLTQEELAERLDVCQQAVAKWENGYATPRIEKLIELAKLLGCSIDDLFAA